MASAVAVTKETVRQWVQDKAPRLAAALSYYTVFALAPLLVLVIGVAGLVWGSQAARAAVVAQASGLVGPESAATVDQLLVNAQHAHSGWPGAAIAVLGFVVGATGVFSELQGALNTVWGVDVRQGGWKHAVKTRLLSFSLIVVVGFLLLVSLVLSAAWAAVAAHLRSMLQGGALALLGTLVDMVVSLAFVHALAGRHLQGPPGCQGRVARHVGRCLRHGGASDRGPLQTAP